MYIVSVGWFITRVVDSTRLILCDPDNDYINANHVLFPDVERKYILTQVCQSIS